MPPDSVPSDDGFLELRSLVSSRLALDLTRRNSRSITDVFATRSSSAGCRTLRDYYERLQTERDDSPLWTALIDELTIAETYFFRDSGQMDLLRTDVLPELLRQAGARTLRIWSAGCSTGEEPYSLAMLLDGLRPTAPGAQVEISGTDVNPVVLEQARRGIYRERSLRSTPALARQLYFQRHERDWELIPRIRERVAFWPENLIRPTGPVRTGIDLIVCRNVLIYFEKHHIAMALERFVRTLRPGGYLLTGHGELQGIDHISLETCAFQSSLIYRKPDKTLPQPRPTPPPPSPPPPLPPPQAPAVELDDLAAAVRLHLQRGELEQAREACQVIAFRQPMALAPRLLEAHLARRLGHVEQARKLLQKALYLEPESPLAYVELALLSARDGDFSRARKLRSTALEVGRDRLDEAAVLRACGLTLDGCLDELDRRLGLDR